MLNFLPKFRPGALATRFAHIKNVYHNSYGQQTFQGGSIPRGAPIHKVTWSSQLVRSRHKLNKLYLHFQKTYGLLGYIVAYPEMILWSCEQHEITNWKKYIIIFTKLLTTKLNRLVTLRHGSERKIVSRHRRLVSSLQYFMPKANFPTVSWNELKKSSLLFHWKIE